jgi:hypothetical protein
MGRVTPTAIGRIRRGHRLLPPGGRDFVPIRLPLARLVLETCKPGEARGRFEPDAMHEALSGLRWIALHARSIGEERIALFKTELARVKQAQAR